MVVIHPSTLNKLVCKLQYSWSRDYQTLKSVPHREFGLAIHYALERYYGFKEEPVKAFLDYMDEHAVTLAKVDNARDLGAAMLTNYLTKWKNERFHVICTEKEIARRVPVPIDDPHPPARAKEFYIGARIDAIVHDQILQKTFVLEHKTFDKFYSNSLDLDHQFVIEKFVADGFLKRPVAGVLYNGLRKSSTLAKHSYVNLFERHPIYITDEQVRITLHRVYWTLMETTSEDFKVYPEPSTMVCNFCDFKQPCIEYQRGGDWQFYLDNVFQKREEDDNEWFQE